MDFMLYACLLLIWWQVLRIAEALDDADEMNRLRKIETAAHNVATSLNGGFIRCETCGDQEDTTDIDFARELYAELGIKVKESPGTKTTPHQDTTVESVG